MIGRCLEAFSRVGKQPVGVSIGPRVVTGFKTKTTTTYHLFYHMLTTYDICAS